MVEPQLHKGQKLGNYIIDDFLGRGGFANVYLARHMHFRETVAIKVLNERELQETALEQFLDEARKLRGLKHDNIIKISDCGVETDPQRLGSHIPYLVMDYAPKGAITRIYPHKTRMPLATVVQYVKQIASALQCAHDQQPSIVHLDVKPENILLMAEGHAVLSDFGIAVSGMGTENLEYQRDRLAEREARKEQILFHGTPIYMAPECWQGHTQRATDQYALGVVAYEWLCGNIPFRGTTADEIGWQHLHTSPPPFWRMFSDVPKEVEAVIMQALAKKPEDRYKRVIDFALALEKAAAPAQPSAPLPPTIYPNANQPLPIHMAGSAQPQIQQGQAQMIPPQMQVVQQPGALGQQPIWVGGSDSQRAPNWSPQHSTISVSPRSRTILGGAAPDTGQPATKLGVADTIIADVREGLKAAQVPLLRVLMTDGYFLRTYRNRRFFFLDLLANLLLTLPVLFSSGLVLWFFGMFISYCLLWFCALAIKKPVAILAGVGIALWWGYAVNLLISVRFHASDVALWSFVIVLLLGLGIHIWYVKNRVRE